MEIDNKLSSNKLIDILYEVGLNKPLQYFLMNSQNK